MSKGMAYTLYFTFNKMFWDFGIDVLFALVICRSIHVTDILLALRFE